MTANPEILTNFFQKQSPGYLEKRGAILGDVASRINLTGDL
jgi:hypothetical protein